MPSAFPYLSSAVGLEWIHPGWIALSAAGILLVWWASRSLDPLSPARRSLALALRISLLLLLTLALTDPRMEMPSQRDAYIWMVDVSDSMGDQAFADYGDLPETWKTLPGSHRLMLFAGKARFAESAAGPEHLWRDPLDPDSTDLARALRVAQASLPPDHRGHLIVLSDGNAQAADWEEVTSRLAAREIRVHTLPVDPPDRPEVLVRDLRAPQKVRRSEPFTIDAEIVSNRDQPATLRLYRAGALVHREAVHLHTGRNHFSVDEMIENESVARFSLHVDAPEDTFLDNNERTVFVQAEGPSQALLVTDSTRQARYLTLALRQEGIHLDVRPEVGAPQDLGDLQNYDLFILDNVPATELTEAQLEMYTAYVRDFGGGFLMLGGDRSFGLGGYHGTPLDRVLPLRSDLKGQEESPSVALALILDKSGSMSGERIEMARAAAIGAVDLLTASDYAGVVAFDGDAEWVADMQRVTDPYRLQQLISSIQAGGGTNLAPGMELALHGLRQTPAKIKHAIVLSDGHSVPGPFTELSARMTQEGITVSTVGVGRGVDVDLLRDIARRGQGRYYYTERADALPQIMAQDTMTAGDSVIQEFPFAAVPVRSADFLSGIDFSLAPFLYGHVRTTPRETADVWLATEDGDPLFATWRYGLGRAGGFTSDARNRWALEWLPWEGYPRFWAQTVRHLQRTPALRSFPVEWNAVDSGYRIAIDAVDQRGEFLPDAKGRLLAHRPGGDREETTLEQTAPGRFEAKVEGAGDHPVHLDIRFHGPTGEELAQQFLTLHPSFSDEYLLRPTDREFLQYLSDATDGVHEPDLPGILATDRRRASREVELWPWLVAFALGLFMLDVANKRLPARDPGPGLAAPFRKRR